ncbi:MAG TPA: tetratricopeptide repeat protein, partial [Candidatus Baltobacteraceae bacterium]|nr:tetratricopeptide repeat protein [Candidatus Baltobacteraceae bacterium]
MGFRQIALLAIVLIGSMCAVMRADADTVNYKLNTNPDTAPSGFVSDPVGAVTHAREKIAAGDLNGAIKGLSVYVSVHPSEIGPKRFLGDLLFRAGEIGRAENIYVDVLREYPYDKETHNRLGTAYAVQNRIDDAIREFDASLPGTESVGDLVQLHQRRGDLPAYKKQTQRMADLYPSDPDMQSELGQVYAAVHEPYEAIVYFRRALDSDQASLTALNGLGLALMDIHDYSSAIAQFDKCLKMQPGSFQCLDNLGAA